MNRLATLATMPFLITYAMIEYSYFVLCMQFDINQQRLQKFRLDITDGFELISRIPRMSGSKVHGLCERALVSGSEIHITYEPFLSRHFYMYFRVHGIPSPTFDSKKAMNGSAADRKGSLGTTSSIGSGGEGDDAASVDSRGELMPERRMGRDEEFEELLARWLSRSLTRHGAWIIFHTGMISK